MMYRALLKNPFWHFVMIGTLLFSVYELRHGTDNDSAQIIHVDQRAVETALANVPFVAAPLGTPDSAATARRQWVEQEVLYREALERGLDQGDTIIRRHLIRKMDFVLQSKSRPPVPSPATLTRFWQENAANYQQPARYSFYHVFSAKADPHEHALLQQALRQHSQPENAYRLGERFIGGYHFRAQPPQAIDAALGEGFAAKLSTLETQRWAGSITSPYGHHWIYIYDAQPARPATFAEVRDRVYQDWMRVEMQKRKTQQLDALVARYDIATSAEGETP